MIRAGIALAALLLSAAAGHAQTATSRPGAAQMAVQATVSGDCVAAIAATNPDAKETYEIVFGPACSDTDRAAGTAALQAFDIRAWEPAPNTEGVAPASSPQPPQSKTVRVLSPQHPEINGLYSIDATAQANINSVVTYISTSGHFPAGDPKLLWKDAEGTVHSFATPALFLSFSASIADYIYLVQKGDNPPPSVIVK